MQNIAIFASGEGTNAENIIRYFQARKSARVVLVVYNRRMAGVRRRAADLNVTTVYMNKEAFGNEKEMMSLLDYYKVDFIVLSGFLLLTPAYLLRRYENRITNIHPALMPRHCGKGMYGMKVHEDVLASGDKETGITIHLVDEQYDHGRILLQKTCPVLPGDSAVDVANRVHRLEYEYYPQVIEQLVTRGLQSFNQE
jgi:phosphoribosylglycinamide formyltransferase-1